MKNGKPPLRAGNTATFTEEELDLLPEEHKILAKSEIERDFEKNFQAGLKYIEGGEDDTDDQLSEHSDMEVIKYIYTMKWNCCFFLLFELTFIIFGLNIKIY